MNETKVEQEQSWAVRAAARYRRMLQEKNENESAKRAEFQKQAVKLWEGLRRWLSENTVAFNQEVGQQIFKIQPSVNSELEITANTEGQLRELIASYDPDAATITCQKPKLLAIPDNVITIEADPDTGDAVFAASDSRYYSADQLGSTMLESLLYANWED